MVAYSYVAPPGPTGQPAPGGVRVTGVLPPKVLLTDAPPGGYTFLVPAPPAGLLGLIESTWNKVTGKCSRGTACKQAGLTQERALFLGR